MTTLKIYSLKKGRIKIFHKVIQLQIVKIQTLELVWSLISILSKWTQSKSQKSCSKRIILNKNHQGTSNKEKGLNWTSLKNLKSLNNLRLLKPVFWNLRTKCSKCQLILTKIQALLCHRHREDELVFSNRLREPKCLQMTTPKVGTVKMIRSTQRRMKKLMWMILTHRTSTLLTSICGTLWSKHSWSSSQMTRVSICCSIKILSI